MPSKLFGSFVAALIVGACSFHHNVAWDAIDYNRSMADAANGVVLINVLRAKDREPMHFSHLTKVSGKIGYGLSTQLSFPFGQNLSTLGSVTNSVVPLARIEGGPGYDIISEDDREFMQGILSPVDSDHLFHYWNQGWNRDLLLHVFVESIEQACPGQDAPRIFVNTPFDGAQSGNFPNSQTARKEFLKFTKPLLGRSVRMEKKEAFRAAGPPLPNSALHDVKAVTTALKEGTLHCRTGALDAERACTADTPERDRRYRMGTRATEIVFVGTTSAVPPPTEKKRIELRPTVFGIKPPERFRDFVESAKKKQRGRGECTANLTLRSVQGIIYYLGEVVRADARANFGGKVVRLRSGDGEATETAEELFLLRPVGVGPGIASFGITHKGTLYRIPENPPNRSAQVLSLVGQLLGLHRKSDKFLSTQSVRILN